MTARATKAAVRRRPIRLKFGFTGILTTSATASRSNSSIRRARGEYRIARNANEKDALVTVPGAGLTTAEQLGLADKGDRIDGIGQNSFRPRTGLTVPPDGDHHQPAASAASEVR